ncbi:polyprenyl synthetase family protein [Clostridium swellfunianum]|uniref:polyprenyl synthetase family protein n=1 Tax=Clostridium swellfunianum TaxID=1367462 RepID=UPI002030FD94|nr:polyprenyl synthetase family protein [Clostridium swellfunianum]MCM0648473.1 polyprenyl synthetase family protein [Clostridium swellfunianum]
MNRFWDKYPSIKIELEKVVAIMKENAKNREKTIENSILGLIDSGGKLLRPGFLIISGKFGEFNSDKLCNLAAVMEMLHMATLVHDDIVDEAKTRRGKETVQSKYGKDYAVYMGDLLFCRCFMALSNNTSMENMKLLSEAIYNICTGEIEQLTSHFSQDISTKKYLKRIAAKTAELFSLSFYVGAYESSCSNEMINNLSKIGYDIGMAFQIIDDILDYNSSSDIVGKPTGNDLREGIYTLPLIYAFKQDKIRLTPLLSKDNYSDEDISKIISITNELGGIDKARALAKRYTDRAFIRMEKLPDGDNKQLLIDITQKLLWREY